MAELKGKEKKQYLKEQEKKRKELEERTQEFLLQYRSLRKTYRCDIQSYLKFSENGIAPGLRIIDVTEQIKEEGKSAKKTK